MTAPDNGRCRATDHRGLQCTHDDHPDIDHHYDPANPGIASTDPADADWRGAPAPLTIIDIGLVPPVAMCPYELRHYGDHCPICD